MWEDIAGDVAGDALLGGAALCQRRYLRGIVVMRDPCWGLVDRGKQVRRVEQLKETITHRPTMQRCPSPYRRSWEGLRVKTR